MKIGDGPGTVPGPIYCNHTSTRLTERTLHSVGDLIAHAWQEVRVDAQGELDVCVSQQLLRELRVHNLGEKDRGTGMSQVVEADIRQPRLLEERLEAAPVFLTGILGMNRVFGPEPLLSLVHDDFPVGELRGRKKVAQVLPYPLLGLLVALFRVPLLLKDANRNDLALPGSQDEVRHESRRLSDEGHKTFLDLSDHRFDRIGLRTVVPYRRKHLVLLSPALPADRYAQP